MRRKVFPLWWRRGRAVILGRRGTFRFDWRPPWWFSWLIKHDPFVPAPEAKQFPYSITLHRQQMGSRSRGCLLFGSVAPLSVILLGFVLFGGFLGCVQCWFEVSLSTGAAVVEPWTVLTDPCLRWLRSIYLLMISNSLVILDNDVTSVKSVMWMYWQNQYSSDPVMSISLSSSLSLKMTFSLMYAVLMWHMLPIYIKQCCRFVIWRKRYLNLNIGVAQIYL